MPNPRNGSKGDSNPGSLDYDAGILPPSYRALLYSKAFISHHTDLLRVSLGGPPLFPPGVQSTNNILRTVTKSIYGNERPRLACV